MKKILIIGGAGYIGSKLYLDYKSKHDVTLLDICWFNKPYPHIIHSDFNNKSQEFYSQFDIIILLAAHSSVRMCEGPILEVYKNNIENFINLISKLQPHQKFIYASSSSVYGDVGESVVDETYTGFVPHNHYDITKHIIDLYAPKFPCQYYGLRFGTVNGYSPIVRNDIMINSMVYNAIKDNEIKLYIKDILRPILGINDLSRAIESIILTQNDYRGIYNLASFNSTAEEIANVVSEITGVKITEYQSNPTQVTNSKLQTKSYNFSINCDKFKNTFDFKFNETIESITNGLLNNFNNIIFTSRNQIKNYE